MRLDDGVGERLLIMSCSDRKVETDGPLPAWDLYDGVMYRVWDKAVRDRDLRPRVRRLVLSAEHGLIGPDTRIWPYDRLMDETQARRLQSQCVSTLQYLMDDWSHPAAVFLAMGKTYLRALEPVRDWSNGVPVYFPTGGIGMKLRALKQWLRGDDRVLEEARRLA